MKNKFLPDHLYRDVDQRTQYQKLFVGWYILMIYRTYKQGAHKKPRYFNFVTSSVHDILKLAVKEITSCLSK